MKFQSSKLLHLAAMSSAGLALVQATQAATILTGGATHNAALTSTFGSASPGTPDINLLWSTSGASVGTARWEGYDSRTTSTSTPFAQWPNDPGANGVFQLDGKGAYGAGKSFNIAFTPSSATIAVNLISLDMNDWIGSGTTTMNWSVTGSVSGPLGGATGVTMADGTVQNLSINLQGTLGETLTLSLTPTTGTGSYFAIDNISFDQVPEPSSVLLGAAGLGALALRRRRKN